MARASTTGLPSHFGDEWPTQELPSGAIHRQPGQGGPGGRGTCGTRLEHSNQLFQLVPEPIYEEGAVEVPGYRGFGPQAAEQIFTTVKLPGTEDVLAKLMEICPKKKNDRLLEE